MDRMLTQLTPVNCRECDATGWIGPYRCPTCGGDGIAIKLYARLIKGE